GSGFASIASVLSRAINLDRTLKMGTEVEPLKTLINTDSPKAGRLSRIIEKRIVPTYRALVAVQHDMNTDFEEHAPQKIEEAGYLNIPIHDTERLVAEYGSLVTQLRGEYGTKFRDVLDRLRKYVTDAKKYICRNPDVIGA
ncbi:MAG: hypothetical protein JSV63_03450, partial [Candidatus Aenigmatarchaeota archaeon]